MSVGGCREGKAGERKVKSGWVQIPGCVGVEGVVKYGYPEVPGGRVRSGLPSIWLLPSIPNSSGSKVLLNIFTT